MPAISDEELNELREKNEALRGKIAQANEKKAENELARQREYEATQLAAENLRLQNELAAAEAAAKVNASREGAAAVMDPAKEQLEAAQARLKANAEANDKAASKAADEQNGGN